MSPGTLYLWKYGAIVYPGHAGFFVTTVPQNARKTPRAVAGGHRAKPPPQTHLGGFQQSRVYQTTKLNPSPSTPSGPSTPVNPKPCLAQGLGISGLGPQYPVLFGFLAPERCTESAPSLPIKPRGLEFRV